MHPYWFILIYLGRNPEQKPSLGNHEIICINAAVLSTLMPVYITGKFNFCNHFHIIKLIRQFFPLKRESATSH